MIRDDVKPSDIWDTTPLYADEAAWEKAFGAVVQPSPVLVFQGKLGESPETLKSALECALGRQREFEKLYTYAHLRSDENLGSDRHRSMVQRAIHLLQEEQQQTAWFEPELLTIPKAFLSDPTLVDYCFYLEKALRMKPHTLSAREEELVAMAGKALNAPHQAFGVMTDADFQLGTVVDGKGEEKELTQTSYSQYLRDPDRTLRKNAFEAMHGHYNSYGNTLCELLQGQVQSHLFESSARHFPSCLDRALFPKNIPTTVYHSLIEAVRSSLPKLHNYLALRKKVMGVDELHLYDVYVPLVDSAQKEVSYDDGVDLVIDSVAPLGTDYQEKLSKGLKGERWVDRYENEGKRSGAYSSGCFDSYPYILMNYQGILRDTFTLAHEAGHSMHSLLSRSHQPYHYSDYPIFVAEVASTFNEELLMRKLLAEASDPKERAFLINQKIEDIRATLFRQTLFAEFELFIHTQAEEGIPLTPSVLREKFLELNRDYFGPDVTIDEEIGIEWARIPHFYYNYYVYQYATGISAALALAEKVLSSGDASAYLKFLSSGSSAYPIDLLKMAGVDVTTPEPVTQAIGRFGTLVDELALLLDGNSGL